MSDYLVSKDWDSSADPTTREYTFVITDIEAWPDGYRRPMTVINGQFPGPLIEVNDGDRLIVHIDNQGESPTTFHFHGLYQNQTNFMDGVNAITQCEIPSGSTFTYNFTVEGQYGTYWYHSHFGTQYQDGLVGPLVVHSTEEDDLVGDLYDYDQIIMVQDWYHDVASSYVDAYLAPDNENTEPVPDNGLINGRAFFNCSLTPDATCYQDQALRATFDFEENKTYRFRVINTGGFAEIDFSIDDHLLYVIEADGTIVHPVEVHKTTVAVAQRYSVLMTANVSNPDTTAFWVRAELNKFCFKTENSILDTGVKGIARYINSTDAEVTTTNTDSWDQVANVLCKGINNTMLVPQIHQEPPDADIFIRLDAAFLIKGYQRDRGYFNSTTWYPASNATLYTELTEGIDNASLDDNQYVITVSEGNNISVVDILINSLDDGSHPFHLHGYKFWVIDGGSGMFPYKHYASLGHNNPVLRDTVQVQPYGWMLIRFIADNPGMWAFHCHISWHLEAGLLMQFRVQPDKFASLNPPDEWYQLCERSS
ncbi:Cupredoxin [Dipodascopsis uninucleata]